jgi:DNA-binding MarR family transcriptional regulator/N-acetylglutamate synthase-like GNAT family acetyltransferase
MGDAYVGQVRSFNRTVTERVGALRDDFLGRGRALGEARVLWEIGRGDGEVRSLRARLHLDSGYMSRVLRALERDGLVVLGPGEDDRRVRTARLTAKGRAERDVLDRRSDALARSLLAPLDDRQRAQLVAAMADVERLLTAALIRVVAVDPSHPDAVRCLHAYFEELSERFDGGFEERQSRTYELDEVRPPHGIVLVAYLDGRAIGCGSLKGDGKHPPEIKRLWVDREARGLGVGRRLLEALEDRAASTGARSVRLDTNAALTEAIALYRATGYIEVSPFNNETYAHHWFSKRVAKRQVGYKDK